MTRINSFLLMLVISASLLAMSKTGISYSNKPSLEHIESISKSDRITDDSSCITGRIGLVGSDTFSELVLYTFDERMFFLELDESQKKVVSDHQYRYARMYGTLRKVELRLANNKKVKPKYYLKPEKIILYILPTNEF